MNEQTVQILESTIFVDVIKNYRMIAKQVLGWRYHLIICFLCKGKIFLY